MSMTDPVADFLTRIRNANMAAFESVTVPYAVMKEEIARVLKEEGYIRGYEVIGEGIRKSIVVSMKYTAKREKSLEGISRVSKPGKRVYVGYNDITNVKGGLGVAILSTPKGILTDADAKKQKVGGEWICTVW
jgi:small subunit ribosomal protein S8